MKTVEQIIEQAEELSNGTEQDERVITMLKSVSEAARAEERARLIMKGEEMVALFLDGPLRDSVYSLFDKLKEV